MSISRCLVPGSFDPVTLGHLDVVRRASRLYDEVVVAVLVNPAKTGLFTPEERVALIRAELADIGIDTDGVEVVASRARLLVDVCREQGAGVIVKGVRGESDYAYEVPMAAMNRHLADIETVFLPSDPRYTQVSSSLVKEVARLGGDVSAFVGPAVATALAERVSDDH